VTFDKIHIQKDLKEIEELLNSQRAASLITKSNEGKINVGLFNPIFQKEKFILHMGRRDDQVKDLKESGQGLLVYQEFLGTVPSHWIGPQNGGKATMFYRYAEFSCKARIIDDLKAMTPYLQKILDHYQPEKGYDPLDHTSDLYIPGFKQILVVELTIQDYRTKWKLGQAYPKTKREAFAKHFRERHQLNDLRAAHELEKWIDQHPNR